MEQTMVAGGNIPPSRFVKYDTTEAGRALVAGAGEATYGVSQEGTRRTPYSTLDDGFAAIEGETLKVYIPGDECMLESGGIIAVGDRLISGALGVAVASTVDGQKIGAEALTPATAAGILIKVRVIRYERSA